MAHRSGKHLHSVGSPLILGLVALVALSFPLLAQKSEVQRGGADAADHFKKWLREDVVYIISAEEKDIFSKLRTDEEREQFIEQFWQRRDGDSSTVENEFKLEHYRRIQYANDWFASGEKGWKTDRGRIYVMYGPPTEMTRYGGGQYERPFNEGGGVTTTYPFEKWVYRHIDGIGENIELEFVDDTMAGEYRLAMSPHEKDALLNVPNAGLTLEESLGLVPKSDRIRNLYAANPQPTALSSPGIRDSVFERMHQFFAFQRPPAIQFKDLKEKVTASVQYNLVPFRVRADWVYLATDEVLVPVTVKIENQDLTYQESFGTFRATVNVYGSLRNLQGHFAAEFEDTLTSEYTPETLGYRLFQNSVYQKQIMVKPGLYRLDLIVRDVAAGKMGTLQTRVQIPALTRDALALSPVILSRRVEELKRSGEPPGLFEVGDLKIIPEVGDTFTTGDHLYFYIQAYNVAADQISGRPSLRIAYAVRAGNDTAVLNAQDDKGDLIHYYSPQRVVFRGTVPVQNLVPGSYRIEIEIVDRISNRRVTTSAPFHVTAPRAQGTR